VKNLLLLILLTLPCVSISQITDPAQRWKPSSDTLYSIGKLTDMHVTGITFKEANKDVITWNITDTIKNYKPLILLPEQVFNIYVGLKQGDVYKARYADVLKVVDSLTNIVEQQDYNLNQTLDLMKEHDAQIKEAYENMPVVWYKSPYLYGALGLLIGILITK